MKNFALLFTCFAFLACSNTATPPEAELTRDEARQMAGAGGKFDSVDLCAEYGWYDDDICDEFCPEPDPDCGDVCETTADCNIIVCVLPPCPSNECIDGVCVFDNPSDECGAGERYCPTCSGNGVCTPYTSSCPAVYCPPEVRCDDGEHECRTCGDGYVCAPDGTSCPLVTCPPSCTTSADCNPGQVCIDGACDAPPTCPAGEVECPGCDGSVCLMGDSCPPPPVCPPTPVDECDEGETVCRGCEGNVTCAPEGVSCPLLRCPGFGAECSDTCEYAGDGECDDGGPDSDYSLCALGTDCMDCGPR